MRLLSWSLLFFSYILATLTLRVNALINDCSGISMYIDFIAESDSSMQTITSIEHVADSNMLAVGTSSGHVELWDYLSSSLLTRFAPVNATSPTVKKIIYLHSFDRLLVLNSFSSCRKTTQTKLQSIKSINRHNIMK